MEHPVTSRILQIKTIDALLQGMWDTIRITANSTTRFSVHIFVCTLYKVIFDTENITVKKSFFTNCFKEDTLFTSFKEGTLFTSFQTNVFYSLFRKTFFCFFYKYFLLIPDNDGINM